MKILTVLCAAALLAAQSGCARSVPLWTLPEPPSEELRRSLGPLAVVAAKDVPSLASAPVPSRCGLATLGALPGMGAGLLIGLGICGAGASIIMGDPITGIVAAGVILLGLGVAAVGVPLGGIVGAINGVSEARPSGEVEDGCRAIERAVARADVPELLRRAVLEELLREPGVDLADPSEARTLLVIEGPVVGFAGPLRPDPPMRLFGEVRFRLVRAADGAELHAFALGFRGGERSFSAWIADDADRVRAELLHGASRFAERAVDELFRVEARDLPPVDSGDADELRWAPLQGAEDVAYDLRVVDVPRSRVVYARDGLLDPVHRLEERLPRTSELSWSVRARYRLDGRARRTAWTSGERDGECGPDRVPKGVPFPSGPR